MPRGQLRVYLGSAPGVGKTYRMLDEGWRRRERGTDVVIAFVETHNRPQTNAQLRDLEVVARVTRDYRGTQFQEMDVGAVLARQPKVALVDELAHTNAPGSANEKRWQDVEQLLDAGIDVITTVNIQHLESVNDVVEKITGIVQQETIPDAVVRRAEQIELVDISPEALRRRMAHGNIYAADKIDTSLSNYFRVGNLGALRELALLWLADRVEDALQRYLDDHHIDETWETRERLIVGVTGTTVDETLLRRAARIASRTGAELIAVHVHTADGLHDSSIDTSAAQELVREFEGSFHEIVDDDIATALVAFARAERGTQIVLGAARPRSTLRRTSGVVEAVIRHTRDLDVHIIAVGAGRPARVRQRRQKSRFTVRRQGAAFAASALVLPLLTVICTHSRHALSSSTIFLVYLVVVVALSTWGGAIVGVVSALIASGLENYYFVPPVHTLQVARPDDVVALVAFLLFASGASIVVSKFEQRSDQADRARAEAQILGKAAGTGAATLEEFQPLLESLRVVFAAPSVAIIARHSDQWTVQVASGEPVDDVGSVPRFEIDADHALVMPNASLDAQDQQLVHAFAGRIASGLRSQNVLEGVEQFQSLAESVELRKGVLRAASSVLRSSLTTIESNVGSLSPLAGSKAAPGHDATWETIRAEVRNLGQCLTDLIDIGRLEAHEVTTRVESFRVGDVIARVATSPEVGGRALDLVVPGKLAELRSDPFLFERIVTNVVINACRHSPIDQPIRVLAGMSGSSIEILVIDRRARTDMAKLSETIAPFQYVVGTSGEIDLGLSVASGFVQLLGGQLRLEDTPAGGLSVSIEVPSGPA